MFHIKFCVKCNWTFGGFLKIHITFHKNVSNIRNRNNAQQNYLSIELLLISLTRFFVQKTRFLPIFFQIQNFGWGYTRGKIEPRNEDISLYTFLRISARKINILKKTKLGPIELSELNDISIKKMLLNLTNILKSTTKNVKKMKKK